MTAGLVEQHSSRSTGQDNGKLARRRRAGAQLRNGLVGCLAGKITEQFFAQGFEAFGASKDLEAGLQASVAIGNGHHHEANAHLIVFFKDAIGIGHDNATT